MTRLAKRLAPALAVLLVACGGSTGDDIVIRTDAETSAAGPAATAKGQESVDSNSAQSAKAAQ